LLTGPSKKFDSIQNAFGAAASECRRIRRGFMAKFQEKKSERMSENVIQNATTCSQKCRTRVFCSRKKFLVFEIYDLPKPFNIGFYKPIKVEYFSQKPIKSDFTLTPTRGQYFCISQSEPPEDTCRFC